MHTLLKHFYAPTQFIRSHKLITFNQMDRIESADRVTGVSTGCEVPAAGIEARTCAPSHGKHIRFIRFGSREGISSINI